MQRNAGATSAAEQTLPIGGARALVRPALAASRREGQSAAPSTICRSLLPRTSLDSGAGGTTGRVEAEPAHSLAGESTSVPAGPLRGSNHAIAQAAGFDLRSVSNSGLAGVMPMRCLHLGRAA